MAWDKYFRYAGAEVINASRTAAYAKELSLDWVKGVGTDIDISSYVGDSPYVSPSADVAPWYASNDPATAGFAGIIPVSITGLEDSSRQADGFEFTRDGGNPGRIRHGMKEAIFSVALVGDSDCAVEAGFRWLKRTLLSHPCVTGNMGPCRGEDLAYFSCEPDGGQWSPDYARHLRRVVILGGPRVTGKRTIKGCPGATWTVQWTARIGDPYEYFEPVQVLSGLGSGDNPIVYGATYEWTGVPQGSSSTKSVDGVVVDTNYHTDPSLEAGAVFNPNGGSNTPVQDTTHVHSGTYATLVNRGSGSASAAATHGIQDMLPTRTIGQSVKVSCYLWVAGDAVGDFGIRLNGSGVNEPAGDTTIHTPIREGWVRVETAGTDTGSGPFNFQIMAGSSGSVWVDDLKITVGDQPHGEYFDGDTPDDSSYGASVFTAEECPVPIYSPIYDPECPALVTPPPPPELTIGCGFTMEGEWDRSYAQIPTDLIPLWDEARPTIQITANDEENDVRNIRVAFYDSTFDPEDDCQGRVGEFRIAYIPAGTTLVIDAVTNSVLIVGEGGPPRPADSLILGGANVPPIWFGLSCNETYYITLEHDGEEDPDVTLDLFLTGRTA